MMKNFFRLLFFIFLLCVSTGISAQKPIVQYPKVYLGDGKNKPFDKEYDLLIPYDKKDTVFSVLLYKHKGSRSFLNSLKKEKVGTFKIAQLKNGWEQIKDTNYLRVELHNNEKESMYTLLKPSKSYSFIIFRGLTKGSKKIIDALRNEYDSAASHTISNNGTAYAEYKNQRARQEITNKIITYDLSFKTYIDFYADTLRILEDSLSNYIKADRGFKSACKDQGLFSDNCIGNLLKLFNGNGCINVRYDVLTHVTY